MRWSFRAIKILPHPELVEGRRMLMHATIADASALHRTRREALHQVALDEEEKEDGGDQGEDAGGHHLAPVDRELRHESEEADGEGLLAVAVDEHEGEEQLAPGGGEDEAEGGAEARERQRQDHAAESRQTRAAVDHRRLLQVLGN